tara:strand:+ start:388 stop:561 length:174 start_codon:yes stop_codon:yes gene_type:complete
MTWFYFHCILAIVILIADARGTLEPAVNAFEKKIGIYSEPEEKEEIDKEIDDEREGR